MFSEAVSWALLWPEIHLPPSPPALPQVLHHAYFSSSLLDSSSEAGDYLHPSQPQPHQEVEDVEEQDEQQQQQQQQQQDVSPS